MFHRVPLSIETIASTAPLTSAAADDALAARKVLRHRLLADRDRFVASPQALASHAALAGHLAQLLGELTAEQAGLYWPFRNESNAIKALEAAGLPKLPLALPCAQRQPREMHYRAWDGRPPTGAMNAT